MSKISISNEYKKDLSITMHQKTIKPMETEYKADLLKQGIATVPKPAKKKPILSTSKNTKQLSDNNCLLLMGSDPSTFFQMNGFNLHQEMYTIAAGIDFNFSRQQQ
jgi:hypothetical protein